VKQKRENDTAFGVVVNPTEEHCTSDQREQLLRNLGCRYWINGSKPERQVPDDPDNTNHDSCGYGRPFGLKLRLKGSAPAKIFSHRASKEKLLRKDQMQKAQERSAGFYFSWVGISLQEHRITEIRWCRSKQDGSAACEQGQNGWPE